MTEKNVQVKTTLNSIGTSIGTVGYFQLLRVKTTLNSIRIYSFGFLTVGAVRLKQHLIV